MGELLTVKEVAKYLRCTPLTAYGLIKRGTIPSFKVGRALRIKKSLLDDWIRKQEEGSFNEG